MHSASRPQAMHQPIQGRSPAPQPQLHQQIPQSAALMHQLPQQQHFNHNQPRQNVHQQRMLEQMLQMSQTSQQQQQQQGLVMSSPYPAANPLSQPLPSYSDPSKKFQQSSPHIGPLPSAVNPDLQLWNQSQPLHHMQAQLPQAHQSPFASSLPGQDATASNAPFAMWSPPEATNSAMMSSFSSAMSPLPSASFDYGAAVSASATTTTNTNPSAAAPSSGVSPTQF